MGLTDWFGGGGAKEEVKEVKKTPSCKICCACPEVRGRRDDCIIRNGEENCQELIGEFYQCLISEGFDEEAVRKLRERSQARLAK